VPRLGVMLRNTSIDLQSKVQRKVTMIVNNNLYMKMSIKKSKFRAFKPQKSMSQSVMPQTSNFK